MSEITRIYTGPTLIAKGLVARLNEIGINPIERNDHDSSMIFIRKDEIEKSQATVDEFLKEIGDQ